MERLDKTISFPVRDSIYKRVIETAREKDVKVSELMRDVLKFFFDQKQEKKAA